MPGWNLSWVKRFYKVLHLTKHQALSQSDINYPNTFIYKTAWVSIWKASNIYMENYLKLFALGDCLVWDEWEISSGLSDPFPFPGIGWGCRDQHSERLLLAGFWPFSLSSLFLYARHFVKLPGWSAWQFAHVAGVSRYRCDGRPRTSGILRVCRSSMSRVLTADSCDTGLFASWMSWAPK